MVKFPCFYLFFSYLYIVCIVGTECFSTQSRKERESAGGWGYTSQNGPLTWGGICQTGKKQSPINIQLGTVTVKNFPSFAFGEDYLSKHRFYAKNNGHTIYVALEDDSIQPAILGGGLINKFIFEQLHFHWESEHEFDGKRADLEMHLVHYNSKYENFAEASTKPDGIIVLAVIFDKSDETDNLIEDFFEYIIQESTSEGHPPLPPFPDNFLPEKDKQEEKSGYFALRDLLPKYTSRFFRYEGSLTTPSCGEVVQWTVFINRLPVSGKVLEAFRTLRDHDGNQLLQNFRPTQKLNERNVYIQIKNYDEKEKLEFEQLGSNGCSAKAIVLINVLYCCLFMLSTFN